MSPSPFDAIADTYDRTFTDTTVGRYQRAIVTDILVKRFRPGMHVVEVGCGTGADTEHLAKLGVKVTAIDPSSRMIAVAHDRLSRAGLRDQVQLSVGTAEELMDASDHEYDGLLSNFGALNCLNSPEIIGRLTGRLLTPGAFGVICMLGRWCAWEIIFHLGTLKFREAFRRIKPHSVDVTLGDSSIPVMYPSSHEVARVCESGCDHIQTTGVGVFIPPSYLNWLVEGFPTAFRVARSADVRIGKLPVLRNLGDHYCLELQRR